MRITNKAAKKSDLNVFRVSQFASGAALLLTK